MMFFSDRGQPDEIFQQATGKEISDNKTINYFLKNYVPFCSYSCLLYAFYVRIILAYILMERKYKLIFHEAIQILYV